MNKNLISNIRKILLEEDPVGLIGLGSPKDEYDNEILSIARKLNENPNSNELDVFIVDLFEKQFEYKFTKEKIKILIDKIMLVNI